jgi:hypothetical protein
MAECRDFKDKETALQDLGTQLGVEVILTPKFHAELAGRASSTAGLILKHFTDACHCQGNEVATTLSSLSRTAHAL